VLSAALILFNLVLTILNKILGIIGFGSSNYGNALRAFGRRGVAALAAGSSRVHTIHVAFDPQRAERLRTLLHQSPRHFGKPTSLWTLDLAADVSFEQGLTPQRVSGETIRATLARLGLRWRRAKHWLTSPDPAYTRKKGGAPD